MVRRCAYAPKFAEGESHPVSRRGSYRTKWDGRRVQRYFCRRCERYFSARTTKRTYRQKKPYLNKWVYQWYASGLTQRRMAKVLGVNRKTVVRKFLFLSLEARRRHRAELKKLGGKVLRIQFDEMLSFEHTRLKPLTIALAVDEDDGRILGIKVGKSAYRGALSSIALAKYGPRKDESALVRRVVLSRLKKESIFPQQIKSDQNQSYRALFQTFFPEALHLPVRSRPRKLSKNYYRPNPNDPLFALNFVCAKIRHDLSRMLRRVWITTKKAKRLQAHLDLYLAYHNQYSLFASVR